MALASVSSPQSDRSRSRLGGQSFGFGGFCSHPRLGGQSFGLGGFCPHPRLGGQSFGLGGFCPHPRPRPRLGGQSFGFGASLSIATSAHDLDPVPEVTAYAVPRA